jgi:uracil-DNA glycosylase family 4
VTVQGSLCKGCALEERGEIFIPADGLGTNKVLLVGDSGDAYGAKALRQIGGRGVGTPYVGPSGWFIDRNLKRIGAGRSQFTLANSIWCKTPFPGFVERPERFPEAALALDQCRGYLDDLIQRTQPKAIVPMGNVALMRITGCSGIERHHAYYMSTPYGIPAIPTFHPSYILKGNAKLSGLWCYAVKRALDVALKAEKPKQYDLLLDPSLDEARRYLTRYLNDPLVCDIETPMSDDVEEDERDDASYTIVRISFSNRAGTAISLPWQPPYISLIKEVLHAATELVFWNQNYDLPRLRANGCDIGARVVDAMFAWHWLQSDLPKALGFVAPLFVCVEPWKQMANQEPARYSALDSAITMDTYLGIKAQLESEGRWKAFERHCVDMFPVLDRMSQAGVMLDLEHQGQFKTRLEGERDVALAKLQIEVPDAVKPLKVWKKRGPAKPEEWPGLHQYGDGWAAWEPFNPASPKQVKDLITHLGLPIPRAKGEDRESTEAKHLKSLSRKNKIFGTILDYRERAKLIDSYMWEVKDDHRVHTTFSFHPSTWRKSSRNPNVQTVPKRNDLASEFRRMVVASEGNTLVECDSSAIEAVLVGFFANSPRYTDLAKKGVHKWLAQEYAQRPVSKSEPLYDQIKRVVHLSNYMGTPQRIHEEYSDVFASVKEARTLQDFYFATPAGQDIKRWHQQVLEQAHKERYLENPWKYRHYFYSVFQYSNGAWVLGDDAKRAVAFLPQSTASAIQSEFVLEIERTRPLLAKALRWIVHDSIICEVPVESGVAAAKDLKGVMEQPHALLGGLAIGAEVKIGPNLRDMETV